MAKNHFSAEVAKTCCATMAPQAHKNTLISFVNFCDGVHCEKDHEFTQAELGEEMSTNVLE